MKLSNNERFVVDNEAIDDVVDDEGGVIVVVNVVLVFFSLLTLFCVCVFVGTDGANGGGKVGAYMFQLKLKC